MKYIPVMFMLCFRLVQAEPGFLKSISDSLPDYLIEKPYTFVSAGLNFQGTLTLPKNKLSNLPVTVLVHGSGPNDRDETIGPNKPFRDLAWGLAKYGIATYRYDKRTFTFVSEVTKNYDQFTLDQETVDDAVQAVLALKSDDSLNPASIFIIGHSQGAFAAPRIAQHEPDINGVIMLAGNARPLQKLLLEQYNYVLGIDGITDFEQKIIDELKIKVDNLKKLSDTTLPPANQLPLNLPGRYWLSFIHYDPVHTAEQISTPLLILQGEEDYQVSMQDFALWQSALQQKPQVTLKSYPGLNHLFFPGQPGVKSKPSDYQKVNHVDPLVIRDIAMWIHNHSEPMK